jgi:hypothetical protein
VGKLIKNSAISGLVSGIGISYYEHSGTRNGMKTFKNSPLLGFSFSVGPSVGKNTGRKPQKFVGSRSK